jgi:hypothetical protein
MTSEIFLSSYAKAIAEAKDRREAQEALDAAVRKQTDDCGTFFRSVGEFLSKEMGKANEGLAEAGFKDKFDGLYAAKPPEFRMAISFGGAPDTRDITLDLSDRNYPTIRIKDVNDSPTASLQFVLKDVGKGMQAFVTEGGGTAKWSVPLSAAEVAARTIENVIDGLFR